ncbi:MAG: cytochrome c oxidase subunit 3 [Bacteroidetes bacterium]|jgi:cytochrome c oxidase subunit 3|nr:cytochrome c oxidase subunit 3 [Bacteroidota bacterium]MDF1867819.1 cytochrome c oxidase subunit 3 [Saprospiraceae bacterium]
MAADTSTLEHQVHESEADLWEGGQTPFKASYGKLMMWYFLLSDAFTFSAFLITYGALRVSSPTWPVPDFVFATAPFGIHDMPLIFVTVMSFLLIISSVTMVRAVQEGHRENPKGVVFWMLMTIIGGLGFLGCQAWEWNNLINTEGMTIHVNPFGVHTESGVYMSASDLKSEGFKEVAHEGHATYYLHPDADADTEENRYYEKIDHFDKSYAGESIEPGDSYLITAHSGEYQNGAIKTTGGDIVKESFGPKAFGALFFCITGFHGFHVFSGVVFLLIICLNVASGLYVDRKNGNEMVEKIGLYWHFVDLVWVFVFLVFYLL